MPEREYATWVQPIASVLMRDAATVLSYTSSARMDSWDEPSQVEGWSNKDVLAHLAGGNDQLVQTVLRAVIDGQALDPAALDPDTDGANEAGVAERRNWSVTELIAAFEREREQMMGLLARLSDVHEDVHPGGASYSLGELMRLVAAERHDALHLAQMQGRRA